MEPDQIEQMLNDGGATQPGNTPDPTQAQTPPAPPAIDYQKLYTEQQAQMQQMLALQQQQAQMLQSMQTRPNVPMPPPVDPLAGFDEPTAKALRGYAASLEAKFDAQLKARDAHIQQLQVNSNIQQIANMAPANIPQDVVKGAQDIFANLSSKGIPLNASDALSLAIGEAVKSGKFIPGRVPSGPPTTISGGSFVPTQTQYKRPANFDQLPQNKQFEIMAANGELDAEF